MYGEPIDSAIKSERLVLSESITSELALGMLVKQRVDLLIESEPVVVDLAARHGWSNAISASNRPVNLDVFYLGFSKQSNAIKHLPEFNRAIEKLQKSGALNAILNPAGLFTAEQSDPE